MNYIGKGKRTFVEGERVLNAHHLILCGFTSRVNQHLRIFALCSKTSGLKELPHELKFLIDKDKNSLSEKCSCVAGVEGKCKHGVALLLFLNRLVFLSLSNELKKKFIKKNTIIDMITHNF